MLIPRDKVRDVLITKTAIKTLKPEQVVDRVIAFQFKDARDHTKIVDEIEISGFGKFYRSVPKTRKKLEGLKKAFNILSASLEDITKTEEQKEHIQYKLENMSNTIKFLEAKIELDENRRFGNIGGSEEHSDSTGETEG